MTDSNEKTVERTPEIIKEFESAQNAAKMLGEEIEKLLQRIGGVMREVEPTPEKAIKDGIERNTVMSQRIGELGDTVWNQVAKVQDAIRRIEL